MKKIKKRTSHRHEQKKSRKIFKIFFLLIITLLLTIPLCNNNIKLPRESKSITMFLASNTNTVELFELVAESTSEEKQYTLNQVNQIPRGIKVTVQEEKMKYQEQEYSKIKLEGKEYYVASENLVKNQQDVVKEAKIYIRNATSILKEEKNDQILSLAKKGESYEVLSYDKLNEQGEVNLYKVKKDEIEGFVYGKYTTYTEEEATKRYQSEIYDPIHGKIANTYQGGEPLKLDFYPYEKPQFANNKMPENVYALYLNCGSNTINNIDQYIEFAKTTNINAFVVDIKDNETPAYPAKVLEQLSPTNYQHAINSYEAYKNAITKLKEANFYVIGRITTFKDSYYVQDHPEEAILNKSTNSPYQHNGSYWPSAYSRNVWYYNVALAKEAVQEFGFNEINFDYVRFPDRMNSVSHIVDLKNTYEEDKTEAIQRFVQYACDVLHAIDVYVSIDVFGETTNSTYTTAYGQYWPAISNVADVISGMPYPDHFSAGSYGLAKPWNDPYNLMKYWASYATDRQQETTTPAKVRTWIQAYDVMKYVDQNGISYNANEVESEIRGLYESGATDGYITWLSNSSLEKYQKQAKAFQIDYGKEYKKNG